MESYQMIAKTLAGLEEVVMSELTQLGASEVKKGKRAVYFIGTDELMYKANFCLRAALSILIPVAEFEANDEKQLYQEVLQYPWEEILTLTHTFSVHATVSGNRFTHSKYVALKVKDAIADRFRNKKGKRPDVDPKQADYPFHIHVNGNRCSLSINSSGNTLDKRGYRIQSNEAPINESLAAGIILKSGWQGQSPLYDPMSGSGTFGIEAALIASHTPPGIQRSFAFQNWSDYNKSLYEQIKSNLTAEISEPDYPILCRDLFSANLNVIAQNAERAGISDYLRLKKEDFFQSSSDGKNGIVFLNPPYGERLEQTEIESFYKKIGDQLKNNYPDCEAWVISSNIDAMKCFGLKPASRERVFNGGLECTLNKYLLY
jgi:putative N6-adenine-specific DNA methylase